MAAQSPLVAASGTPQQPESPRTPKGAAIPQSAYTVCPGAPGPKYLLEPALVGRFAAPPPCWWDDK